MNFIMGMLLLVSGGDEQLSFEAFMSLSFRKEYMLVGLYENGFPLMKFLEYTFDYLFQRKLPNLYEHFKSYQMQNSAYISKWLLTLYIYSFSLSICIRIMDYMISSNVFALVYVAIQILTTLEKDLLKMDEFEIINFLKRKNNNTNCNDDQVQLSQIDINKIIKEAHKLSLSDKQISQLATDFKQVIYNEYQFQIDKVNHNDPDSEIINEKLEFERNNVMLFIEFYALQGKELEQMEYIKIVKERFMNQDIIAQYQKPSEQQIVQIHINNNDQNTSNT